MAEKKLHLRVFTPERITADEKANMVIIRCTTGDMGFLPGHVAYSAVLDCGVMRVFNEDGEERLAIFGGLAEIRNDVLTILANAAERPEDIDLAAAQAERDNIKRLLQEPGDDDAETQRHKAALKRSLVRVDVASYALANKQAQEN